LTRICICVSLFAQQLFLVSGYFGVEDLSFFVKEIFSFLKDTHLVPVEMELVPEFGSPPISRFIANYEGQNICVQYASQSFFAALFQKSSKSDQFA